MTDIPPSYRASIDKIADPTVRARAIANITRAIEEWKKTAGHILSWNWIAKNHQNVSTPHCRLDD